MEGENCVLSLIQLKFATSDVFSLEIRITKLLLCNFSLWADASFYFLNSLMSVILTVRELYVCLECVAYIHTYMNAGYSSAAHGVSTAARSRVSIGSFELLLTKGSLHTYIYIHTYIHTYTRIPITLFYVLQLYIHTHTYIHAYMLQCAICVSVRLPHPQCRGVSASTPRLSP